MKTPESIPSGPENPPDWSDLRKYTRAKQAIAGVVRRLDSHFRRAGDEPRAAACRELMELAGLGSTDSAGAPACRSRREIADIQQSLSALRDAILRHDSAGLKALDQGSAVVVAPVPPLTETEPQPAAGEERDLPGDLQAWGCPVCKCLMDVAFEFHRKFQYKLSADEAIQRVFADQWGFCPLHTWQLAALASPQGLSLGYPKLLERVSAALSGLLDAASEAAGAVASLVPSPPGCEVCRLLQSEEQEHIARLSQFLAEPAGRDVYARGHGVCLRHLAVAAGRAAAGRSCAIPARRGSAAVRSACGRHAKLCDQARGHPIGLADRR